MQQILLIRSVSCFVYIQELQKIQFHADQQAMKKVSQVAF